MTLSKLIAFGTGFLVAALLFHSSPINAATITQMFGSNSGAAKAVAVTSTGAVIVSIQ